MFDKRGARWIEAAAQEATRAGSRKVWDVDVFQTAPGQYWRLGGADWLWSNEGFWAIYNGQTMDMIYPETMGEAVAYSIGWTHGHGTKAG